jgi:hypothetical protein
MGMIMSTISIFVLQNLPVAIWSALYPYEKQVKMAGSVSVPSHAGPSAVGKEPGEPEATSVSGRRGCPVSFVQQFFNVKSSLLKQESL